jgi:hypothetical protein
MLIEDLIRLGRPLLDGDMELPEVIRLITDVEDQRVKNFYRHVFVVSLPADGKGRPNALPMQEFGEEKDGDFEVDLARATSAPFVLPSGGNPLNPQGRYGVPVYPCYDPHIRGFQESADNVVEFLGGRLDRTAGFSVPKETIPQLAEAIHDRVTHTDFGGEKRILAVLVLARCEPGGFYAFGDTGRIDRISAPERGRTIVPNYSQIVEGIWSAKVEEGREGGQRSGPCSFSGEVGQVVSAYCKAWPWAFPTWSCPLPHGGDGKMLVEGIGMSPATYRALTLGACVFNRLTQRVSSLVIPEIFSPGNTRAGKEQAQRRNLTDLPSIYGAAFLLPVQDATLADREQRESFCQGVRAMLTADPHDATQADRYITAVVGFDAFLPPDMASEDYRLTLVYFSGDYTRGDIHLRACIQDVIPSTLSALRGLALSLAHGATRLLQTLMPLISEKQRAYFGRCYQSVPYLLARAYGGAYLWQQLEMILHRKPLDTVGVTANAARRIQSMVPQWPKSRWAIADEVGFYLSFLKFLSQANVHPSLANQQGADAMAMQRWEELIRTIERAPIEEMKVDSLPELGFACGLLIRRFSGWYSYELGKDRDFLKDRILTFGANLSPRDVSRGVRSIRDVAHKFDNLRRAVDLGQLAYYPEQERKQHFGDYARRLGIVLAELQRQSGDLEKSRDEFMTGFWSGYSLQGYDRPRKTKESDKQPVTQTQE